VRLQRLLRRAGLAALAGALVILAIPIAGCAKLPLIGGKPTVKLKIAGTADLNNCGKSSASLSFRVVQATDASPLTGATLLQFWDREKDLLAGSFVDVSETKFVDPGKSVEFVVPLKPDTRAVVVVGNFCKTLGSCWYVVAPRKGGGGVKLDLTADASCLSARRK